MVKRGRNVIPRNQSEAVSLEMAQMRRTMTLQEIGDFFGVTREAVRLRLTKSGYFDDPEYQFRKACGICGERFLWGEIGAHSRSHKMVWGSHSAITPELELLWGDIAQDYLAGMRLIDISRKYRTSTGQPMVYHSIYRILRRQGIEPNRGGGHYERTDESVGRMVASQRARRAGVKKPPRSWRASEDLTDNG